MDPATRDPLVGDVAEKEPRTETVAGVDGCRGGWVVATWCEGADHVGLEVVASFGPVAAGLAAGRWALVAVDMPIGLPEQGPRVCDRLARGRLGPRRSSVFPAPVRATLGCASYAEALATSRAVSGRGLPIQAWHLVPKIREVDAAVRLVGSDRLLEVHPELAFAALDGAPLVHAKRSPAGRAARQRILAGALPGLDQRSLPRLPGAAADDVADALALVWSARRLSAGRGCRVGGDPDATGLPMAISW